MSIIYDALTKVQRSRKIFDPKQARKKRLGTWFDRLLILVILSLIIMAIFGYFSHIKKKPAPLELSSKKTLPAKPLASPALNPTETLSTIDYTGQILLNGIFISGKERFAIINNQTVHVGDTIDNKKIMIINYNNIVLRDNMHWYVIKNKVNL